MLSNIEVGWSEVFAGYFIVAAIVFLYLLFFVSNRAPFPAKGRRAIVTFAMVAIFWFIVALVSVVGYSFSRPSNSAVG